MCLHLQQLIRFIVPGEVAEGGVTECLLTFPLPSLVLDFEMVIDMHRTCDRHEKFVMVKRTICRAVFRETSGL